MSDLIDRKAAIRKIEPWLYSEGRGESEINMLRAVIAELKSLPAAPRWHRVEEPPEEEGKYLVYDGRGNYYVAWWGQILGWCYDPKFFCYWMPLPEPPKEDA